MGLFFCTLSMHKCGEKFFRCFTSPSLLCLLSADTEGRVFCTSAFLCSYSLCINPTCIHVWDIVGCRTVLFDSALPRLLLCCRVCKTLTQSLYLLFMRFWVTSIFNVDFCARVYIHTTGVQAWAKHRWRRSFRWILMCGIFQKFSLNKETSH